MPFDIFIIGPMGRGPGDAVTVPTHTAVVKAAVQEIARRPAVQEIVRRHGLGEVTVTAPDDLQGSTIATDVFSRLDAAELVVADLSERSPNVFYELAFVDALGLPTILIIDEATDVPFYFQPRRVHRLRAITPELVMAALERQIIAAITPGGAHNLFSNPLREFYDAPVVDISAAAGLAAGYYVNFVRDVIVNHGILDANRAVARGLLVVVPDDVANRLADRERIEAEIERLTGLRLARDQKLPRPGSDRSFTANLLGRLIVDVASAPYALGYSPRMLRLQLRLSGRPDLRDAAREASIARMVRSLLRAFESSLRDQIRRDHDTRRERVLVATPTTLEAELTRARDQEFLGG
jgi:hypothetical protein